MFPPPEPIHFTRKRGANRNLIPGTNRRKVKEPSFEKREILVEGRRIFEVRTLFGSSKKVVTDVTVKFTSPIWLMRP